MIYFFFFFYFRTLPKLSLDWSNGAPILFKAFSEILHQSSVGLSLSAMLLFFFFGSPIIFKSYDYKNEADFTPLDKRYMCKNGNNK